MEIRLKLTIAIAFAAVLTACGGGSSSSNSFTPLPSAGTPTPTTPVGTTPGNLSGFYVEVGGNDVISYKSNTHVFNKFGTRCLIPTTASTAQNINCMVNVREEDLWYGGLNLMVNYPSTMCTYLTVSPYWYYRNSAGKGPAVVTATIDQDQNKVTACKADGVVGTADPTSGTCSMTEGTMTVNGFTCAYDHGAQGNCCVGSGSFTLTTIKAGTPTVGNTITKEYGGLVGNCIETIGDGLNFKRYATSGLPRPITFDAKDIQYQMKIPELSSNRNWFGDYVVANFNGWSDYIGGTWATRTLPKTLATTADLSGDTIPSAQIPFIFDCNDSAFETKHRINVYVNEWDTDEAYETYVLAGSTLVTPEALKTDVEGVNCATTSVPGGPCDDIWNWHGWLDHMGDVWPGDYQ